MRVAVIGSALAGNKGAAAMLESAVGQLQERDPSTSFVLLSMYPAEDRALNTHTSLRVLDARPARLGTAINLGALLWRILPPLRGPVGRTVPEVKAIATADVLLDQGGITFVDGRGKFLLYNVASILPALFVGTPVVKCPQAMGPFRTPANRLAAKVLLPRMARIFSRGAVTHEHLVGLGLENVERGADMAFLLDVEESDRQDAARAVDLGFFGDDRVVGVSPSAVLQKNAADPDAYVAEVVAMIDHLTQVKGYKVFLVPHSARSTDKTHNNDLPLCRAVHARVAGPDDVLFPDTELSSQTLRYLIGRCDLFVASRFHAMVSSLATGVPTLVIGWSHKYREVLDMFGLAQWAVSHDGFTLDLFRERFDALEADEAQVRTALEESLPAVRAAAAASIDAIVAVPTSTR